MGLCWLQSPVLSAGQVTAGAQCVREGSVVARVLPPH